MAAGSNTDTPDKSAKASVCQPAVNNTQAIRAIIGEAGNQGEKGMLAVACAIRNRGTLKGVYGVKAKHVDKQPQWVWAMAKKVWAESATNDITNGATHWENIKAFGKPYWVKSMVKTFEHKNHVFYREK
jgi:spore germination cell wall hydrolase CwlJ-like protein